MPHQKREALPAPPDRTLQKHDRPVQYTPPTAPRKRWASPAELLAALAEAIATVKRHPLLWTQAEPRLQVDRGPIQWRLPLKNELRALSGGVQ